MFRAIAPLARVLVFSAVFFLFDPLLCSGNSVIYDFSSGAGTDRLFYEDKNYADNCRPPARGLSGWSENKSQYDEIASSDTLSFDTNNGSYNIHLFSFTIYESTPAIEELQVLWYGHFDSSDPKMYIWDYSSSTWSYVTGTTATANDITLLGNFTSSFDKYINQSGQLYFLVQEGATAPGRNYTNYAGVYISSKEVQGGGGIPGTGPAITSCETQDFDANGYIDGLKITFDKKIKDSTIDISKFDVAGVTGETIHHADDKGNDEVLLIDFSDNILTTDKTPPLTVLAGAVEDKDKNPIAHSSVQSVDKAGPVLLSAAADDGAYGKKGVDNDDTAILTFSENTSKPAVPVNSIESIFDLKSGRSWGNLASVVWNDAGNKLIILFDGSGSTIESGDKITVKGADIKDAAGNACTGSAELTGSFECADTTPPSVLETFPKDKQAGVATDAIITVTFSEDMDAGAVEAAVSLSIIRDENSGVVDASVPATCTYNSANRTVTILPQTALAKSCKYKARVSADACDIAGNILLKAFDFRFSTVLDSGKRNIVEDEAQSTKLVIEENAIPGDFTIAIINDPLKANLGTDPAKINDATEKAAVNGDSFKTVIPGTIREINLYSSSGQSVKQNFDKPVFLTLSYQDADNDGVVDGTSPPVREKNLQLYWLDEEYTLWVRLPDSAVDTAANTVTAPCKHFSVYAIFGAQDMVLDEAYAFPVPFIPSRGDSVITFVNLSSRATIKIFTVSGALVRSIEHTSGNAALTWDVTNDKNEALASGTYLYLIKNDSSMKKGKLMIVR